MKYTDEEIQTIKEKVASDLVHEHSLDLARIKSDHEIVVQQFEFDIEHLETEELKAAREAQAVAEQALAVQTKENEMLRKITDLNADIIDIKDLVAKLIDKLPQIDLKSLTVNNHASDKE